MALAPLRAAHGSRLYTAGRSRPRARCCVMASLQLIFEPVATAASPTLPRSGHCAVTLPAEHPKDVLVFGGYIEDADKQRQPTNEAWAFSAADKKWTRVAYSSAEVPATRLVSQAVVVGNTLWLIGGWDSSVSGPEAFLGDVWMLDLTSWAWSRVTPSGELLAGISRFQAMLLDGGVILIHTHRCDDHVLLLDTTSQPPSLSKAPVQGPAPSSRGLHSLVRVGDSAWLFGGAPQQGPMLGDLWRLDLRTMAWQQVDAAGDAPSPRCSVAAAAVGGRYIVYSGGAFYGASGGLEMLGDVHVLDTASATWVSPRLVGDAPAPRNAATLVPLSPGGGAPLLLYGGWRAFVESFNDSVLLALEGGQA